MIFMKNAGMAFALLMVLAVGVIIGRYSLTPPPPVGESGREITLEDALKSVGTGLRAMKDAEDAGGTQFRTGLLPDEVTVTFDISAKGTLTNQIAVSAERSGVSILPKGSATANVENNSERGNQIRVTLKNIYFSKEMPLWTAKDADDVAKRLWLIEGSNPTIPAEDASSDKILVGRLQRLENGQLALDESSRAPITAGKTPDVIACNILKIYDPSTNCSATPLKDLRDLVSEHSDKVTEDKLNRAFVTVASTPALH
jgi:hypothetical protein